MVEAVDAHNQHGSDDQAIEYGHHADDESDDVIVLAPHLERDRPVYQHHQEIREQYGAGHMEDYLERGGRQRGQIVQHGRILRTLRGDLRS